MDNLDNKKKLYGLALGALNFTHLDLNQSYAFSLRLCVGHDMLAPHLMLISSTHNGSYSLTFCQVQTYNILDSMVPIKLVVDLTP